MIHPKSKLNKLINNDTRVCRLHDPFFFYLGLGTGRMNEHVPIGLLSNSNVRGLR